ncbi:MAG: tetratricopeptide repeat protein [Candidatus Syntropharchaeia archaeon]
MKKEAAKHLENAIFLAQKKKMEEARKEIEKALEIYPNYAEAYYYLGIGLTEMGLIDEGIKALDRALEIEPEYVEALNRKGIAFQRKGMMKEAIEEYKKALERNPMYAEAHLNLGLTLLECAITEFEKVLRIEPENEIAREKLERLKA